MTDTQPRHRGMRTIAAVTIIALVVGIGGGWLISQLTSEEPTAVWATSADGGTLVGSDEAQLTLKAVANNVVQVDTDTKSATPVDTIAFFAGWNDRFGDEPRTAVVTGRSGADEVQIVVEISNPAFSEIGYVAIFDAKVVSGPSEIRDLTHVVLLIDGD